MNYKSLLIVVLFSLGTFLIIYRSRQSKEIQEKPLTIVATTGMITDAIQQIVGNDAIVQGLMGPGIDPHLYRARESDVARLADADIIFYNGLHLEGKMADLFAHMAHTKKTVAVTDILSKKNLIESDIKDHYDPHIWFDVSLWQQIVSYIVHILCDYDAVHCDAYQQRAKKYSERLKQLDSYIKQQIALIPVEKRTLVTAHDAFEYFGKKYGLHVRGLQGISTESEAGTKDVQDLVSFVVQKQIPAIFVESSIPQRTLQAVQEGVKAQGWNVTLGDELYSDALGSAGSDAGTYIGMVKHNIDSIVKGLRE
jgi:manganese/zinc/iron transport system substrate-binding protein